MSSGEDKVDRFSQRLEALWKPHVEPFLKRSIIESQEATKVFNHSTGDDGSYDMDEFLCARLRSPF